jgi:hypothetical protein
MGLPEMTPLQALVISILFDGEKSSREVRDELAFRGVEMPMPHVYRMLGRAELAGYLCGKYRQWQTPDDRTVREKFYRISPQGLDGWQKTVAFYDALDRPPQGFQPVSLEAYLAEP